MQDESYEDSASLLENGRRYRVLSTTLRYTLIGGLITTAAAAAFLIYVNWAVNSAISGWLGEPKSSAPAYTQVQVQPEHLSESRKNIESLVSK